MVPLGLKAVVLKTALPALAAAGVGFSPVAAVDCLDGAILQIERLDPCPKKLGCHILADGDLGGKLLLHSAEQTPGC